MSDNYVRRLNYSNGQLLDVSDFNDEQAYHRDQRRLHNRVLHGWGIVDGLEVDLTDNGTDLAIRPGSALDKDGREIVLTGPKPEPAKIAARVPALRSVTVYLTIAYRDEDDPATLVKDKLYARRCMQKPALDVPTVAPTDGSAIVLARVTVDATGKLSVDASVRTRCGGLHPDTALAVRQAQVGGRVQLGAADGAGLMTFTSVDAPGASADGITWYATKPADYGIYRASGAWAVEGYRQLQVRWVTGIVLDPGTEYAKSWVEVKGKGLRVTAGSVSIGADTADVPANALWVQGNAGIGANPPGARLDVARAAAAADPALQLRAGNTADGSGWTQVAFGFADKLQYRHAIRTRHHSGARSGNAIDFYVWRWAGADDHDKVEALGTQHALTLDGGNVGIGTDRPGDYRLKVEGGDSSFSGTVVIGAKANFGKTPRQVIDLYGSGFGIGVQTRTTYLRSEAGFAWFRGGVHDDAEFAPGGAGDAAGKLVMAISGDNLGIGTGATGPQARLDVEGDAIVAGAIKGRFRDTPALARERVPASATSLTPEHLRVIASQQAALIQGWASGATSRPDQYPPHLYTIGYIGDGRKVNEIFLADMNTGLLKTFAIDHPQHPERYLLHATLEGPEGAVYYRGSARLAEGRAEIALPPYFEALTRREGRTVLLTNVDGWDPLAVLTQGGATIRDGRFVVASSNPRSTQAFDWEVKAVRSDAPPLEVEPAKAAARIERFGPYAYRRS